MNALPKGWVWSTLGEHVAPARRGINPSKHPSENFDLFSIPAYDSRRPVHVKGQDIGSSKNLVEPGDILLSKIIPHIRRAWVVPPGAGTRQIASSEWITFRSSAIIPSYMKHFLVSDIFHQQFMRTVAGVGGSLLRARPKDVARIPLPLPPFNEQRRIAAILDTVAELIARRYESKQQVDHLVEMAFRAHFAHSDMRPLGEVAHLFGGGTLPKGETFQGQQGGNLLVKVSDMNLPGNEHTVSATAAWTQSSGPKSSTAPAQSVILPKRGGAISTNKKRLLNRPGCLDPNLMGVAPDISMLLPEVLYAWFRTFDLSSVTSGSTVPQLNKKDLVGLGVPASPIHHQTEFARLSRHADSIRQRLQDSQTHLLGLKASLESRAFRGEL